MSFGIGKLRLDRECFLAWAAAIAAASCGQARSSRTAQSSTVDTSRELTALAIPPDAGQPFEPAAEPLPDAEAAEANACSNDVGEVSCKRIQAVARGPSCEGVVGACELLHHLYRPRVASAVSLCWERLGTRVCNVALTDRCIRKAFSEVCPDARFVPVCERIVAECRSRGRRPDFDAEQCANALTSIARESEREWATRAMAPTHEGGSGGCKLMFPKN